MVKSMLIAALAAVSLNCQAADTGVLSSAVQVTAPKHEFMVSGIMRKPDAGVSVRLIHSLVVASSADEAVGIFTRNALAKYPGYSMASTLATAVESPKHSGCGMDI